MPKADARAILAVVADTIWSVAKNAQSLREVTRFPVGRCARLQPLMEIGPRTRRPGSEFDHSGIGLTVSSEPSHGSPTIVVACYYTDTPRIAAHFSVLNNLRWAVRST